MTEKQSVDELNDLLGAANRFVGKYLTHLDGASLAAMEQATARATCRSRAQRTRPRENAHPHRRRLSGH